MATLTATIDASQRTIALSGDVSAAVPGRLYAIEDEIVLLEGFGDWPNSVGVALAGDQNRASWIVKRGQEGSTPATHTSGTTVYAVADGFVQSASLTGPSPGGCARGWVVPRLSSRRPHGRCGGGRLHEHQRHIGLPRLRLQRRIGGVEPMRQGPPAGGVAGRRRRGGRRVVPAAFSVHADRRGQPDRRADQVPRDWRLHRHLQNSTSAQVYDASEGENLPLAVTGWNNSEGAFTGGNAANSGRAKVWYTIEELA